MKNNRKIVAVYDIQTQQDSLNQTAVPVCYTIGSIDHTTPISAIDNSNAEELINVDTYRTYEDVMKKLEDIIDSGRKHKYVPVVASHGLYFLFNTLNPIINKYEIGINILKSVNNPIFIELKDNGKPVICFWDTLDLFNSDLSGVGKENDFEKLEGLWDYSIDRFFSPLSEDDIKYVERNVRIPFVGLSSLLRYNKYINESDLCKNIYTYIGIVRCSIDNRFNNIKYKSSNKGNKSSIYSSWRYINRQEYPKDRDQANMMVSCFVGGMNYCSSKAACVPFYKNEEYRVLEYDATSMYPAQGLIHRYPVEFHKASSYEMIDAVDNVFDISLEDMLNRYEDPFSYYFYGKIKFYNVRLKKDTVFYRDGFSTFSATRITDKTYVSPSRIEENEGSVAFYDDLRSSGLYDSAVDPEIKMSKIVGAKEWTLFLTELTLWEFIQQFDFDNYEIFDGYMTNKSRRADYKRLLSFNNLYSDKKMAKSVKNAYYGEGIIDSSVRKNLPEEIQKALIFKDNDKAIDKYYMSLKTPVNALYGIEVTNSFRPRVVLDKKGTYLKKYDGEKNPKTWYGFGCRISEWARVQQLIFMLLLDDMVDVYVCGDTDSHKIYTSLNKETVEFFLSPLHESIRSCIDSLNRYIKGTPEEVKSRWNEDIYGIGEYVLEGEPDAFYASRIKNYAKISDNKIELTIAGLPYKGHEHSYQNIVQYTYKGGWEFRRVCDVFLSYNIHIDKSVSNTHNTIFPNWGGKDGIMEEPLAAYIEESDFLLGDETKKENFQALETAKNNTDSVLNEIKLVYWDGDVPCIKII